MTETTEIVDQAAASPRSDDRRRRKRDKYRIFKESRNRSDVRSESPAKDLKRQQTPTKTTTRTATPERKVALPPSPTNSESTKNNNNTKKKPSIQERRAQIKRRTQRDASSNARKDQLVKRLASKKAAVLDSDGNNTPMSTPDTSREEPSVDATSPAETEQPVVVEPEEEEDVVQAESEENAEEAELKQEDNDVEASAPNDTVVPDGANKELPADKSQEKEKEQEEKQPRRWDTRSVLEHPPEPAPPASIPENEVPHEDDPSWDVSRIAFDTSTEIRPENGAMEMFDTASWAASSDVAFSNTTVAKASGVHEDIEREVARLQAEESTEPTKEEVKEGPVDNEECWDATKMVFDKEPETEASPVGVNRGVSMFDTESWAASDVTFSNVSVSKIDVPVTEEGKKSEEKKEDEPPPPLKDDEALLGEIEERSDVEGTSPLDMEAKQQKQLERIETYIKKDDESVNSSDDELGPGEEGENPENNDVNDEEQEEPNNGIKDVTYVSHEAALNEETAEDTKEDAAVVPSAEKDSELLESQAGAIFAPAAKAAADACGKETEIQLAGESPNEEGAKELETEAEAKAREASKREAAQRARFSAFPKTKPPLLAPPPPEKLKKWEESKMRALKYLEGRESNKDRNQSTSSGTLTTDALQKARKSGLDEESSAKYGKMTFEKLSDAGSDGLVDRDAVKARWKEGRKGKKEPEGDAFFTRSGHSEAESLATQESLKEMSPPEIYRTALEDGGAATRAKPVTEEQPTTPIIADTKIAAKLAVASSFAAEKFEERLTELFPPQQQEEKRKVARAVYPDAEGVPEPSSIFCGAPDTFLQATVESIGQCSPLATAAEPQSFARQSQMADQEVRSDLPPTPQTPLDSLLPTDDPHSMGLELVGGAFSPFSNADVDDVPGDLGVDEETYNLAVDAAVAALSKDTFAEGEKTESELMAWLKNDVLTQDLPEMERGGEPTLLDILRDDDRLNLICAYVAGKVNKAIDLNVSTDDEEVLSPGERSVVPFSTFQTTRDALVAANFVSFLQRVGKLSELPSPFGDENPFLMALVGPGKQENSENDEATFDELVFNHEHGRPVKVLSFLCAACEVCDARVKEKEIEDDPSSSERELLDTVVIQKYRKAPETSPSPFETSIWNHPDLVVIFLGFLGDPAAVCRMKRANKFCNRVLAENEHTVMRDAVRLGGISPHLRPAFWLWVTLENCGKSETAIGQKSRVVRPTEDLEGLEQAGRAGKWHGVISRDVARAFGNMPPHKTGAKLRSDSIVRALVYWGRGRLMKRGVKGGGEAQPIPTIASFDGQRPKPKSRPSTGPPPWEVGDDSSQNSGANQAPMDTVSDWGGVSPVPSFTSSTGDENERKKSGKDSNAPSEKPEGSHLENSLLESTSERKRSAIEELALSGNALTAEMKLALQNQLGFILFALAATHEDVGYCQGMDYVVAHLLRVLQDTVRWQAMNGTLAKVISPALGGLEPDVVIEDSVITENHVVEAAVFQVMDCFLTTYNLRHMYWPELRCLKTCCRVFEQIIHLKLPVLADHFDHHELNVGLFALGWFQTLFLYLPSMPSATVCHLWDIWLVERSFKIFFRVGTAILFLSQPILLNHDLEGMMTYLNTFPDATLLNPDILIACALQIKITNQMLEDIEKGVVTED